MEFVRQLHAKENHSLRQLPLGGSHPNRCLFPTQTQRYSEFPDSREEPQGPRLDSSPSRLKNASSEKLSRSQLHEFPSHRIRIHIYGPFINTLHSDLCLNNSRSLFFVFMLSAKFNQKAERQFN